MDVGVHEAKTQLSRLVRRLALGEEVVIGNGERVALAVASLANHHGDPFDRLLIAREDGERFVVPADQRVATLLDRRASALAEDPRRSSDQSGGAR